MEQSQQSHFGEEGKPPQMKMGRVVKVKDLEVGEARKEQVEEDQE